MVLKLDQEGCKGSCGIYSKDFGSTIRCDQRRGWICEMYGQVFGEIWE